MSDKTKNMLIGGGIVLVVVIMVGRLLKKLLALFSLDGGFFWLLFVLVGMAVCYPVAHKIFPNMRQRQVARIAAMMVLLLFMLGLLLHSILF